MSIRIQSLGHSCFLLESLKGVRILIDPFLTGNSAASVTADSIKNIDAVLVSHGAFDHMGDAVPIARQTGAKLFCGPDVAWYASKEGLGDEQICQMVWGTCFPFKGIQIRSVEAKHISSVRWGEERVSGIPMSLIVSMEDGTAIYHSGDTSIFTDLKLFGKLYNVEVALICMDGIPGYPFEMSGKEAALAAKFLGVKVAIPMHYPAGSVEPLRFKEALEANDPPIKVVILQPGEEYSIEGKVQNPTEA